MKQIISFIAVLILTVGIAFFFEYMYYTPDPLEDYEEKLAISQASPYAQMTGEPRGYYDKDYRWITVTTPIQPTQAVDK